MGKHDDTRAESENECQHNACSERHDSGRTGRLASVASAKTALARHYLDEEMAQAHVNLCTISSTAEQWCPWLHSEPWP